MSYALSAGDVSRGTPLHSPPPPDQSTRRIRVVLGKKRFDAHDVGARYIMRKLVEAGMETVFIRFALAQELVDAAVQEDADVVALSILTGGHLVVAADVMRAARVAGIDDRLFIVGGVIADDDRERLTALGVDAVFGPGTRPDDVVEFIRGHVLVAS